MQNEQKRNIGLGIHDVSLIKQGGIFVHNQLSLIWLGLHLIRVIK